eukprot:scaffold100224_cov19-Tisochrysis_lutea.AAC.1
MLALVLQICVGGRDIWQLGVPVQRDYCCKHSSNDFDTSPQSCNCPQRCKYTFCMDAGVHPSSPMQSTGPLEGVCDPGRGPAFLGSLPDFTALKTACVTRAEAASSLDHEAILDHMRKVSMALAAYRAKMDLLHLPEYKRQ